MILAPVIVAMQGFSGLLSAFNIHFLFMKTFALSSYFFSAWLEA
jgi:hypothetical protein